jgi:hypothetical protein
MRDQAIKAAGNNAKAKAAAIADYNTQYQQIYQAFTAQLLAAKQALAAATN